MAAAGCPVRARLEALALLLGALVVWAVLGALCVRAWDLEAAQAQRAGAAEAAELQLLLLDSWRECVRQARGAEPHGCGPMPE